MKTYYKLFIVLLFTTSLVGCSKTEISPENSTNDFIIVTEYSNKKIIVTDKKGKEQASFQTAGNPSRIKYNPKNGKLYWTEWTKFAGLLYSSDITGKNKQVVMHDVYSFCIDTINDKIYYVNSNNRGLYKMNLDGSGNELVADKEKMDWSGPSELLIIPEKNQLFWSDFGKTDIGRLDLNGNTVDADFIGDVFFAATLNLFYHEGYVYYGDIGLKEISCFNPDIPKNTELVFKATLYPFSGIYLESYYIYYFDSDGNLIKRNLSDIEGNTIEQLGSFDEPRGITTTRP